MKKRVAAGILWLYAGWFAGAIVAFVTGVSPALGPILGVSAAALIAGDPFAVIWNRTDAASSSVIAKGQRVQILA
jgi:hypothetical protein